MSRRHAVATVALLLALIVAAIAWLTGREAAQQIASAFASPLALGPARVTLLTLDRGVFRTHASYEIAWPLGNGETVRVVLAQRIDHGPWPAQSLWQGQLMPAALAGDIHVADASIDRDASRRPLPLRLDVDVRAGYSGMIEVTLQLDSADLPLGPLSVAAETTLSARYRLATRDLQANLQAAHLALRQGGETSVQLTNLHHTFAATLHDERAALSLQGGADALALWGQTVGPLQQSLTLSDVGLAALGEALNGRTEAWARALPTEAKLEGTLFEVRHPAGETALRVQRLPAAPGLQVHFQLPKAVVRAAVSAPPALAALGTPPGVLAAQQADMAYALLSGQLLATGLVRDMDDGLRADLMLSAEHVIVNGETHTWPAFRARFFPEGK